MAPSPAALARYEEAGRYANAATTMVFTHVLKVGGGRVVACSTPTSVVRLDPVRSTIRPLDDDLA